MKKRSKALKQTATIGRPLTLDLFDKYEEEDCHLAALICACWCMLDAQTGDEIPAWKVIAINEEHNFEDMTIAEMKTYVYEFGPNLPLSEEDYEDS